MKLAYLANPYSFTDPDPAVVLAKKEERFLEAVKATNWLMEKYKGLNVFSPILHSHILHVKANMRGDWAFWCDVDTDYLNRVDLFVILAIPGWGQSVGVTDETKIAKQLPNIKQILFLIPKGEKDYELAVPAEVQL